MPNKPESFTGTASGGFFLESHKDSNYDFELPDHWVPYYMVGSQFVRRAARHFFADGREQVHKIQYGECFVVGPGELRRFRTEGEGSICMLTIDPLVFEEITANSSRRKIQDLLRQWDGADGVLAALIQRLERCVTENLPNACLQSEGLCTKIAEELLQRFSIERMRLDQYKGGLSGARYRLVREYINEHLGRDLDSLSIAAVAGLSKYHFGKAFKESTGVTLYVLSQKMFRAQNLLARTNLPLAEIADAVGMSNQSHLTALFSRRLGVTPRAYREANGRVSMSFRSSGQGARWGTGA
jgi:AraC-like DNA-binding protein